MAGIGPAPGALYLPSADLGLEVTQMNVKMPRALKAHIESEARRRGVTTARLLNEVAAVGLGWALPWTPVYTGEGPPTLEGPD